MDMDNAAEDIAILFSDIVGSTSLYQEIGDSEAHRLVVECLETMRGAVESVGGTLLRTVGDAVLAKFDSCDDAFAAARNMHQLQEYKQLSVRIGFHWGAAIPNQGDVYGNAVNVAARVAGLANGNEIVVTKEVVERLSTEFQSNTSFLTEINVKGISAPLSLFRLRWKEDVTEFATRLFSREEIENRAPVSVQMQLSSGDTTVTLKKHGDKCSIGRGEENNMRTTHATASRLHATITCKQGKFYLEDASTNGTYVIKAPGDTPVFVHRETITVDGVGVITSGFLPQDNNMDQDGVVKYQTGTGISADQDQITQ